MLVWTFSTSLVSSSVSGPDIDGDIKFDILCDIIAENVNSNAEHGATRTRFLSNNDDSINNVDGAGSANVSNLSFDDLATLLRGSADILENNAPRLSNIVNQAGQQG